jgi:hypothetical protein
MLNTNYCPMIGYYSPKERGFKKRVKLKPSPLRGLR